MDGWSFIAIEGPLLPYDKSNGTYLLTYLLINGINARQSKTATAKTAEMSRTAFEFVAEISTVVVRVTLPDRQHTLSAGAVKLVRFALQRLHYSTLRRFTNCITP